MSLYSAAKVTVAPFCRWLFRVTPVGAENIPEKGPVILCCNHRSMKDPFLLAIICKRQLLFMAKAELFKIPLFNLLIRTLGAFPIKRGSGDMDAIRKSLSILKAGKVLAMFPEGTRLKEGEIPGRFKAGASMIAYKSSAVIVPAAIVCEGRITVLKKKTIRFGKPLDCESLGLRNGDSEEQKHAIEIVRNEIIRLLKA